MYCSAHLSHKRIMYQSTTTRAFPSLVASLTCLSSYPISPLVHSHKQKDNSCYLTHNPHFLTRECVRRHLPEMIPNHCKSLNTSTQRKWPYSSSIQAQKQRTENNEQKRKGLHTRSLPRAPAGAPSSVPNSRPDMVCKSKSKEGNRRM